MHHIFPNKKNILALSVYRIVLYMIGFYILYSLFLNKVQTLLILIGTVVGLTLYDIIHYYCHFGP